MADLHTRSGWRDGGRSPADLLFCSRYPFSSEAKEYVREMGVELTSLLLEKSEARVKDALVQGKLKKAAQLGSAQEEELASYAGARMIVSAAANRYLISRYAVAEAKRASGYLEEDAQERPQYVERVAHEFGVKFLPEGRGFLVHFSSYLKFTPRSVDYKLSNRQLLGGNVRVSAHERVRMLEEAVRKKVEGSLPIKAEFSPQVKEAAARMSALIPKLEIAVTNVGQENYPPCIRKLIEDLAMNVNVPHTGRVALAIYLVNAGVPNDAIVDYFRHAPDFSEKTTRYQAEYIRNKKYSVPSCSTMDSYGVCIADCHCGSPMNFRDATHGARLRRMVEEKKEG